MNTVSTLVPNTPTPLILLRRRKVGKGGGSMLVLCSAVSADPSPPPPQWTEERGRDFLPVPWSPPLYSPFHKCLDRNMSHILGYDSHLFHLLRDEVVRGGGIHPRVLGGWQVNIFGTCSWKLRGQKMDLRHRPSPWPGVEYACIIQKLMFPNNFFLKSCVFLSVLKVPRTFLPIYELPSDGSFPASIEDCHLRWSRFLVTACPKSYCQLVKNMHPTVYPSNWFFRR